MARETRAPAKAGLLLKGRNMGFLDKAKDLLAQNADKVDTAIDKAGEFVDSKTQGKYKDTVNKVHEAAKKALDDGDKGDQQN
jgi:MT0933-like antitoxin protein